MNACYNHNRKKESILRGRQVVPMDKTEFGKRLKKARIARRMTQSEVAGDRVTRNMISRIENGAAIPSVGTLEYLSERLDVPISVLVPQYGDEETLTLAKASFSEKDHKRVIELLSPAISRKNRRFEFYDEACALLAKSYLAEAKNATGCSDEIRLAKLSCELADVGVYANDAVLNEALDLLSDVASHLE